jgi:predicted lipid carrier protein YhbT
MNSNDLKNLFKTNAVQLKVFEDNDGRFYFLSNGGMGTTMLIEQTDDRLLVLKRLIDKDVLIKDTGPTFLYEHQVEGFLYTYSEKETE